MIVISNVIKCDLLTPHSHFLLEEKEKRALKIKTKYFSTLRDVTLQLKMICEIRMKDSEPAAHLRFKDRGVACLRRLIR